MTHSSIPKPANRLLSIEEVAGLTGVAPKTLYKWIGQRKIPHVKLGRLVKFDPVKLDDWIKQQAVMPMPKKPS